MKLDYVDIFYHHIFDPNTPLEETALALDNAVRQGKALYVGISNYNKAQTAEIMSIFKELHTPFIVNQPSYSMLNRWIESDGLRDFAAEQGIGLSLRIPESEREEPGSKTNSPIRSSLSFADSMILRLHADRSSRRWRFHGCSGRVRSLRC